jgi:hypothetical protein
MDEIEQAGNFKLFRKTGFSVLGKGIPELSLDNRFRFNQVTQFCTARKIGIEFFGDQL